MPTYEYRCGSCDHQFDLIQRFSDEPRADCPKCQAVASRLISVPAIHFKGSGFYKTDYAGAGRNGASNGGAAKSEGSESSSKDSASPSESGSTTKSESKAESTPAKASSKT